MGKTVKEIGKQILISVVSRLIVLAIIFGLVYCFIKGYITIPKF